MKITKSSIIVITLFLILLSNSILVSSKKARKNRKSNSKSHSKSKEAPRATDLRNHFGTPNIQNQYGPHSDSIAQHVQANPDVYAPMLGAHNISKLKRVNDFNNYKGLDNKMNPSPVKAGEYTNIAPSSTKEVHPEITYPKLEVNGEYEYPMNVKVPTFYGFAKEQHPVIVYDKATGEIIEDTVLIKRPIYNYENRVSNVAKKFTQHYDLRNGERIGVQPNIKKHGFDTVNPDSWVPPHKKDKCLRGNHNHYKR